MKRFAVFSFFVFSLNVSFAVSPEAQNLLDKMKNKSHEVASQNVDIAPNKVIQKKQFIKTPCIGKETVKFKAGIIYNYGGYQAAGRQTFYIFQNNPIDIIKNSNIVDNITDDLKVDLFLQSFASYRANTSNSYSKEIMTKGFSILEPLAVQKIETDFDGNAAIEKFAPGKYYIFGSTPTRKSVAIWNVPFQIENSHSKVIYLDQNNVIFGE